MRRLLVLAACLLVAATPAPAAAAVHSGPTVALTGDTVLDPAALYFVSYDGLVNNESFQQDALTTYAGYVDDSHDVISLGVSPADGRLHVAMDTHNTPVYYVKSVAGVVSKPHWSLADFGPVQRTLDGVELGGISYPQFLVTPEHRLQFSFRTGGSGNGTNELAEYDGGAWHRLGKWTSATGDWTAPNGVRERSLRSDQKTQGDRERLDRACEGES